MQNIILSAGLGTRSGGEKLFYDWKGSTLLHHCVETSLKSGLDTIVVTGFREERAREALCDLSSSHLTIVRNENYQSGQFSSCQRGVRALKPDELFFIMLADLPLVSEASYLAVRDALSPLWDGVRPFFKGKPGHPVLLRPYLRPFILRCGEEMTMRRLLERFTINNLATNDAAYTTDIDTWLDYQAMTSSPPETESETALPST